MDDAFHIYVGSETGLFKAVNLTKNSWCNINKPSGGDRKTVLSERQIEALCWNDTQQSQICLGLTNQTVCIYDVKTKDFVKTLGFSSDIDEDVLKSLARYEEDFVICTKSTVKVWTCGEDPECKVEIKAGKDLECMRPNASHPHLLATGGKQNDLKVWDLNNPTDPVFRAKNVRHDFLNLEVPIWVMDMAFLPESNKVVTCSGHHQIRVYDPAKQRRPVMDIEWDEYPIKSMSLRPNGYHVIVGNARGDMALVDLRGKAYVVQKYKGGAGSIRSVQCHPSQDVVASCGLDRYLRIHDINSKKLLQKFYLKSKLNCLLFSPESYSQTALQEDNEVKEAKTKSLPEEDSKDSDDNSENVWNEMEVVKSKHLKRKSKEVNITKFKTKVTKKDKASDSDTDSDESSDESD